jgi:uncharacterized protein (DUF2235 family)
MPKNIVLLSDGTGNAASSPFKTNVWRLYQALDIGPPAQPGDRNQVAFYDNGVGTETFKPLAMLGLGVETNVKNLYTFLCRNYEDGDKIYLFGFSRGAFTVRLLAGLILRCGVVANAPSDAELNERVKAAYTEYTRDKARRATKTRLLPFVRLLIGDWREGYDTDHVEFTFDQTFPDIEFIGVWDTVDAYGMPIDELKEGIDHHIWPMTLADRQLSDHVHRACQALSLDDERPTFRPVLWTDLAPDKNPGRLLQVWFSGVHANVGGGYPDDGLSCTALQWMMDEAALTGLRFYLDTQDDYNDLANPQGQQYDSRAGLAGYYRYGPRNMDELCQDPAHGVAIARPRVHLAALDRIRERQVAYAPVNFTVLERGYDVVGRSATAPGPHILQDVETAQQIRERANDMELVFDAVFRRRVAYATTVVCTIVLVLMPITDWHPTDPWAARLFALPIAIASGVGEMLGRIPYWSELIALLGGGIRWVGQFAPGWAAPWVDAFASHPVTALFFAVVLLLLFVRTSALLENEIAARAEYAWRRIRPLAGRPPARRWTDRIVRALRTNRPIVAIYDWLANKAVPFLFAYSVGLLVLVICVVPLLPQLFRNHGRRTRYKVELARKPTA